MHSSIQFEGRKLTAYLFFHRETVHQAISQVQQDVSELKAARTQRKHQVKARHEVRPPARGTKSRVAQISENLPTGFDSWAPEDREMWLRKEKNQLDLLSVRSSPSDD